jgi:mxaD protein
MTKIVETAHVGAPAAALWRDIGGFGAVADWHPMLARVTTEGEGEGEGALRMVEGRDGTRQTERLLESSPEQRFYRYKMESGPMPVRDYVAELRVEDNGDGTSTVVWSAEFEPTTTSFRTIEEIQEFLKSGLDSIVHLYRPVLK